MKTPHDDVHASAIPDAVRLRVPALDANLCVKTASEALLPHFKLNREDTVDTTENREHEIRLTDVFRATYVDVFDVDLRFGIVVRSWA